MVMNSATEEEDNVRRAFYHKKSPAPVKATIAPAPRKTRRFRYIDIILGDITKFIKFVSGQSDKELKRRKDEEQYRDFMDQYFPGLK